MRNALLLLFFLFFHNAAYSLNIDSLQLILEKAKDPKGRTRILNTLSGEYRYKDIKMSYYYAIKALELAGKNNYKDEKATAFNRIGLYYHSIGRPDSALCYFFGALEIFKGENDMKKIANSYNLLGIAFKNIDLVKSREYYNKALEIQKKYKFNKEISTSLSNIGVTYLLTDDYDNALLFFNKALHYDSLLKDTVNVAFTLNTIGGVYFQKGIYLKAIKYSIAAIKIFERYSFDDAISKTLNNLGDIYYAQKDYTKALEYYKKSLEIKIKLDDKTGYANTLSQIAIIKFSQNLNTEALEHINKCAGIYEKTNDKRGLSIAYRLMGQIYFKLNNQDKSLEMFEVSVKLSKKLNERYGIAECYSNMGMAYRKKSDFVRSLKLLKEGLEITREIGALELERSIQKEMADVYTETKQCDLAVISLRRYILLNDSVLNIENKKAALEIEAKYETDKKEMELALNLKDKIINELTIKQQKTELKKQRIFRNTLISASILVMLLLLIVFNKAIQRIIAKT